MVETPHVPEHDGQHQLLAAKIEDWGSIFGSWGSRLGGLDVGGHVRMFQVCAYVDLPVDVDIDCVPAHALTLERGSMDASARSEMVELWTSYPKGRWNHNFVAQLLNPKGPRNPYKP